MPAHELPELRRRDYSLSDVQTELRQSVALFVDRECPSDLVRAAEPNAFDAGLWSKVADLGVLTMAVPKSAGGDGAGLVEAALVAEQCGRRIAPVPFVEQVVALRALAATAPERLGAWLASDDVLSFAPSVQHGSGLGLIPAATVAKGILGLIDDELVLVEPDHPAELVASLGGAPLGRCDLTAGDASVLARGDDAVRAHARARREWQVLIAAALVGLATGALDLTVAYANERTAFGVPIGAFQALSHPLADVRTAVEGARHLVWRAAWYLDHEPELADLHVSMAYLHACETAQIATARGIHTQGGFGFTLESDLHLYFRRAKSWPLVAGDPQRELVAIAELAFGPVS